MAMSTLHTIAMVVRKVRLDQQGTDFAYWQTQSYESRLAALEEIRCEYHNNDTQSGLQRVLTVVKR